MQSKSTNLTFFTNCRTVLFKKLPTEIYTHRDWAVNFNVVLYFNNVCTVAAWVGIGYSELLVKTVRIFVCIVMFAVIERMTFDLSRSELHFADTNSIPSVLISSRNKTNAVFTRRYMYIRFAK